MMTTTTKEDILIEALPYIQRYEGKTFVIKYGGAAMTDLDLQESFAKDVTLLKKIGINIIIVHGGGKAITDLSGKLGLETRFHNGHRYTDSETLSSVVMTLVGTTNKDIVRLINRNGGSAVGLSGMDGGLLRARKFLFNGIDLGFVGEVESVNTKFIELLLSNGSIPVIAPVGVGADGEMYNINADLAAASIASALNAEKLFYMTDTEGILIDGELIPTLTSDKAKQYIAAGTIAGGMVPKVQTSFDAIEKGVKKVHIINGTALHSILLEIFTNVGVGTQIIKSEKPAQPIPRVREKKEDFLDFSELTRQGLYELFHLADKLRKELELRPLAGKSISLIFQKPSLRTRISFEVGIAQLGGIPIVLNNETIGLGVRESAHDVAKVLSRYNDAIIARVFDHSLLTDLASNASVPVVNALSDLLHPCQILADVYTLYEQNLLRPGMKIVFIGDGNNVANSWIEFAGIFPMHFVLAAPEGFEPDPSIMQKAIAAGISTIEILRNPVEAARNADVLYTDVWTSMGQEEEKSKRIAAFEGFTISEDLLQIASPECVVMHCLPAHRGEEITDEAITGVQSVIFEQAENRLHIQKALLCSLFGADEGLQLRRFPADATTEYEKTTTTIPA
ncbi:MAG: ornithine carbamoyltransferase [Bacteroidota bacterium]|nr:ornithine carbamoyltransferase [Bacteroidota bacterium]